MNLLKQTLQFACLSLIALPFTVSAESWSCRHGDDVREIHIKQETSAAVPCSVVYRKLTEGVEDQTLWTANSDAGYCAEKAKEFIAKQESWGWTCVETISEENTDDQMKPVESSSSETPTDESEPDVGSSEEGGSEEIGAE